MYRFFKEEGKQGDEERGVEDRTERIAADSAQLCFYCHCLRHHHVGRWLSMVFVALVQRGAVYGRVSVRAGIFDGGRRVAGDSGADSPLDEQPPDVLRAELCG